VEVSKNEAGKVTLRQEGLINKILSACNMKECNTKSMPCNVIPLRTDGYRLPCKAEWEYASVIGMLIYLCSNSRADIQFAVN
jgi:hypothetical protein